MGASKTSDPKGKSLLSYLEWRADNTPDAPCFKQPNSDFSEINTWSYSEVLQIVDNLASWILEKVGTCEPLTTLAFLGGPDPRYVFVPLAAKRANFTALYLGGQNSYDANAHLCKETKARAVLYVDGVDKSVLPTDHDLLDICVPELEDLTKLKYSKEKLPDVDHEHGTFLCLHSSGSTGMPKPIEIASECLAVSLNRMELDDFEGFPPQEKLCCEATLIYFGIPIYHMSGFVVGTRYAFYYGVPVLYMPRDRKPGAKLLLEAIDKAKVDAALCAPGIFNELVEEGEDGLEKLKNLKFIASGGGILPQEACNKINEEYVQIMAVFGSTEITDFEPICHLSERSEWEYFHISPKYNNIDWKESAEEGSYELVIKRDPEIDHLQGVFYNFPDRDEFPTGDLFSQHPDKKNYWRYESRADDQISFENASTLNPIPIEDNLKEDENIQQAMIVGNGRPFPILVIEPSEDAFSNLGSKDEIKDKLWETVASANKKARANGQIASKRHIVITDQESPLVRTAKLTVSKKAAVQQYNDAIEEIYNNATKEDHRDLSTRIDE